MKTHQFVISCLLLLSILPLSAGTVNNQHTCGYTLTQDGRSAYLSIETVHGGDVRVYLEDGPAATNAVFRGSNGMGNALNNWQVKVGTNTPQPAANYFTKDYSQDTKELYLRKKPGAIIPDGAIIYYTGGSAIEWKCNENGNLWKSNQPLSHLYGSVCGTLDAPQVTSLTDDGVITFTSVGSADYYMVFVYHGSECYYQSVISSGETIDFHSYLDCTYDVFVQAYSNGGDYSGESNSMPWTLEANLSYLPASELCAEPFGTVGGNITWETDIDGNIVITISGAVGTAFRANGMGSDLADFTVDGQPASIWFDRVYNGSGSVTYTLQLRDPSNHPTYGAKVRYRGNAHSLEYITPQDGNAYSKFNFDYIYGTTCPRLQAPTDIAVSSDGIITFADVPYAEEYEMQILRGELVVGTYAIQSGEQIPYQPYVSYPYTIYIRALAEGMVPSPMSEPYIWLVSGIEVEPTLSTMCQKKISNDQGGIYLTVETLDNGDIQVSLSGPQNPVWRNEGIKTSAMYICGYSVDDYFDKPARADYEGQNSMTLRLKSSARNAFCTGDRITYSNAHVEWFVNYVAGATNNVQGYVLTYSFDYIYGTGCSPIAERLTTPTIQSITPNGQIDISPVTGADAYEVIIYDGDGDEVWHQTVTTSSDSLERGLSILAGFDYCVRVRATTNDATTARPSLWSDCYTWQPEEVDEDEDDDKDENDDEDDDEDNNNDNTVTPTTPTVDNDDHTWPDPEVTPTVQDTLADQTDTVPPILPRDTLIGSTIPDTIAITVVDTLADQTDPIPDKPIVEAVDELMADDPHKPVKIVENGQVFILIDDRKYTLMGQLVEE